MAAGQQDINHYPCNCVWVWVWQDPSNIVSSRKAEPVDPTSIDSSSVNVQSARAMWQQALSQPFAPASSDIASPAPRLDIYQ